MFIINPVKSAYTKFCNFFVMPFEFRKIIAEKNKKRTVIGLILTSLACIFADGILCLADTLQTDFIENHRHFIQVYLIAAAVAALFLLLIKFTKTKNIFLIEFPLYLCASIGTLDCLYSLLHQTEVFNALIFFLFLEIIISIIYTIQPLFFLFLTTFSYFQFYPNILREFGSMGAYNTMLLFAVLLLLCLYKWKNTKRLLIKEHNFNLYKEALQSEVDRQMDEIKVQHKRIVKMQNHTIISLSNLVENRDSDTGEHVRRTSKYVRLLAQKAQHDGYYTETLTDDYIHYLYKAAPMHDIGKIVVSDVILKKPGKLTDEEFAEMQKHALEGGRIVKEVLGQDQDKEYVTIAMEIATGHHEKWNGCGYPSKLKESEIPLSARIMAIADVFDALVSPRCYKEPFPVEKAFSIIQEESGTHFDPILVKEFLEIKEPVLEVFHRFTD